jgi:hypothetical protein
MKRAWQVFAVGSFKAAAMTRVARIALLSLLTATSAHAEDVQISFVEFKDEKEITTYDLRTVEVIQPGKFVIVETVLDNPDVMKFELKVLDTLRSHCARPVGFYTAPAEVFTLGPPDMSVKEIEVSLVPLAAGTNRSVKVASWWLPYSKMKVGAGAHNESYMCNTTKEEYIERRNVILNGIKNKFLFDCNRGLRGVFFDQDESDYRKARVYTVQNGTVGAIYYKGVCRAVTRKDPYLSE